MRSDNAALQCATIYAPPTQDTPAIILGAKRILELDSDVGPVIGSGSRVTNWVDQSALGNSPSQPTAGKQPLQVAGVLDGHAAIRTDGSDDSLRLAGTFSGLAIGDRPYIYCVSKPRAGSVPYNDTLICLDTDGAASATSHLTLLFHTVSNIRAQSNSPFVSVGETSLSARLLTARFEASTLELDLNNVTLGTVAMSGMAALTPIWLTLGDRVQGVSVPGATDYFRIVFANPAPSASQHARMLAYLRAKYPSCGIA
jgi:hypothetical protein